MVDLVVVASISLIIGALIGVLFGRMGKESTFRQRRVEQQLDELRSEFTRYQAQVSEHFSDSAKAMKRFHDAYDDINELMARGAFRLGQDPEWMEELEKNRNSMVRLPVKAAEDDDASPPRDYAPKKEREPGTLTEGYGLRKGGRS